MPRDQGDAVAERGERVDDAVERLELAKFRSLVGRDLPAGRRVEDGEVVAAVLGVADGQGPVGEEDVVLQAEDPRDLDELGVARDQRARLGQAAVRGSPASSAPSSATAYRFHQPVRSLANQSSPAGLQSGCRIDSCGPPATSRSPETVPSPASSAVHSSVPSHGIRGWSQLSQARRRPSGLSLGAA